MANDLKKGAAAKTQRPERMNLENDDKYPYHCSACGKGYMRQKDNMVLKTPSSQCWPTLSILMTKH